MKHGEMKMCIITVAVLSIICMFTFLICLSVCSYPSLSKICLIVCLLGLGNIAEKCATIKCFISVDIDN